MLSRYSAKYRIPASGTYTRITTHPASSKQMPPSTNGLRRSIRLAIILAAWLTTNAEPQMGIVISCARDSVHPSSFNIVGAKPAKDAAVTSQQKKHMVKRWTRQSNKILQSATLSDADPSCSFPLDASSFRTR